jgi:hypothetical protein
VTCAGCAGGLTGRQTKWCSTDCQRYAARADRLFAHFAITPAEYDAIFDMQDGLCAICRKAPKPGKRLAVDHDHQSGLIRGLLCFYCNKRVLGARSADVLIRTAAYVTDPPARAVIGDRIAPGRPPKKRRKKRVGSTKR